MARKIVECVDWVAPNRPGILLRYAERLKKEGVNLDALWAYTSPHGEPKIAAIAKKPARLRAALRKMEVDGKVSRCILLTGKDKAGVLVDDLRALAEAGLNVECADALAVGGKYAATLWVREADLPKAKQALRIR